MTDDTQGDHKEKTPQVAQVHTTANTETFETFLNLELPRCKNFSC